MARTDAPGVHPVQKPVIVTVLSKPATTKKGAAKRPPFVTSLYNEADYAPDDDELDDDEPEELDPFTSSPPGQNS